MGLFDVINPCLPLWLPTKARVNSGVNTNTPTMWSFEIFGVDVISPTLITGDGSLPKVRCERLGMDRRYDWKWSEHLNLFEKLED